MTSHWHICVWALDTTHLTQALDPILRYFILLDNNNMLVKYTCACGCTHMHQSAARDIDSPDSSAYFQYPFPVIHSDSLSQ